MNKKIGFLLISIFIVLFTIQSAFAINFSLLTTYTSNFVASGNAVYQYNNDYLNFDGKLYDLNSKEYVRTNINFTNGSMDNNYYYKVTANGLMIFDIDNGNRTFYNSSLLSSSTYGTTFDEFDMINTPILGDNKIIILASDVTGLRASGIAIVDKNGIAICSFTLKSAGVSVRAKLLGNDDNYIFVHQFSSSGEELIIMDYNCNRVYVNSFLNNTLGIASGYTNLLTNIYYDTSTSAMIAYLQVNNSLSYIITFDNTGYVLDIETIPTGYRSPASKKDICAYNFYDKTYNCLLYYSSLSNISVLSYPIASSGAIGSRNTTSVTQQLNINGYKSYYYTNPIIYYYDNNLFIQLYDTITLKYDLFVNSLNVNPTSCNGVQYSGLSCFNDSYGCLCFKEDALCFPNIVYNPVVGDVCSNAYSNCMGSLLWQPDSEFFDSSNLFYGLPVTYVNGVIAQRTSCKNNYDSCVGNTVTPTHDIVSSNYLSFNNYVDSNGYLYAELGNITYCAGGCINNYTSNVYGVSYTYGVCTTNATNCVNDCSIEGLTYSDSSTSYKRCGFYDEDVCLDWSSSFPCGDGYYSEGGFCRTLDVAGFTYYSNELFKVNADISNAFTYSLTTEPPESTYKTGNVYQLVGFDYTFSPTTVYINKNCDFSETNILTDNNLYYVNTTQDFLVSGYTNGVTTIKFILANNGSLLVTGKDTLDRPLYIYNVTYNSTLGFCLYDNTSLLGCQIMAYSDMKNLELSVQSIRPNTNQLFSSKLVINKVLGGSQEIYRGFSNPLTIPASTYGKITLLSTDTNVTSVIVNNGEQYLNTWKNTTWTQLKSGGEITYQHNCIFSKVGCYTVRSYLQEDLREGLWNYKDWKICINSLSGASIGDMQIEGKLSPMTKLILALAIPIGLFLLIFILGYSIGQPVIASFVGIAFSIGLLIYFSIKGWLPAWIIIIMFLTSAFVIVMLVRGMFAGKNEM